ncbi:MAG: heme A synthase [Acidimicrobiia bacterium]|nr:heme A synthase [Acidimicrobiia bacterium]
MALPLVSPAGYRKITLFALVALAFIVLTGAAVRLTGSGLGCTDWPTCEQGRLGPSEITDAPAMIEFVNRLITGLVSVAVMLAVGGAARRLPRRRDLMWLAGGLVAGVLGQIVLGGLVVLFELSPRLVMGHFLVSMLILWNAVVLHHRAGRPDRPVAPLVTSPLVTLARAIFVTGALVVFTGTVVTASGPHAGDIQAARLGLDLPDVARVHGIWVVGLVVQTVALVVGLARQAAPASVQRAARLLLGVLVAQAAVGYTQYFTGVPVVLVGIHILGAVLVWVAVVQVNLAVSGPTPSAGVTGRPVARSGAAAAVAP